MVLGKKANMRTLRNAKSEGRRKNNLCLFLLTAHG